GVQTCALPICSMLVNHNAAARPSTSPSTMRYLLPGFSLACSSALRSAGRSNSISSDIDREPTHILLPLISGKISLYVTEFLFPTMANSTPPSSNHPTNSRYRENGGLVTTMSASSRNAVTSSLRKSPSPSRYDHCISWKLTRDRK